MPKGSKRNRLARVRELCDFDESLVTRRHGNTEIPKSGQGDMGTRGHRDLYLPSAFSYSRPSVAGFDEAGRGALAGPVIVGCIHFPFFSTAGQESVFTSSPVRDVSIRACPPTLRLRVSSNAACQRLSLLASSSPRVPSSPRLALLEDLAGIDDSKRLTPRQRETLLPRIKAHATWGVGFASADEIDKLGIVPAVSLAARRAYRAMSVEVGLLLCDRGITVLSDSAIERLSHLTRQVSDSSTVQFLNPPTTRSPDHSTFSSLPITQSFNSPISRSLNHSITQSYELSFTRGDSRSLHIAAASILAKVTRDQIMVDLDAKLPGYGLAQHKGYGTPAHIAALRRLGPSPIHRSTFRVK